MFKTISKIFRRLIRNADNDVTKHSMKVKNVPNSIKAIKKELEELFLDCNDFIVREITIGNEVEIKILIAFMDGLVDKIMVNDGVLRPLMIESRQTNLKKDINKSTIIGLLKENLLSVNDLKELKDFDQTINNILSGDTVIYIDGQSIAFTAGTRGWEQRGVEEPDTEAVVRGPREGFCETLRTNTSLLRRKIKNPNLKLEMMKLGRQTNTDICISYIKGLVNEDLVKTVKRRLSKIDIDAILETGYIEELIEDAPLSIFPTVGNSEKPDIVAAKLLEGRVAIFCDGTPFVLIVPYLLIETIQAGEDYYSRSVFASFIRLTRILALIISGTLPAIYVALVSFHQNVIPFKLLLTITASKEGIPFSAFTEAALMGLIFELLREAGVRMPRPVGQAISIVGALVLGEAAVQAGITSTPMVIVTALTAISSFIIPPLGGTLPLLRFVLLIAANILGLMGIMLTIIAIFVHLCTLRSFGVPYLAPFAPLDGMDLKDTFVRVPLWMMLTRPKALLPKDKEDENSYRMKKNFITKED